MNASWRALLCGSALLAVGCYDERESSSTTGGGECTSCHGSQSGAGSELVRSAPPRDLFGNTASEYPGVGAHERHLYAGDTHGAIPCSECHVVPSSTEQEGHADSDAPAETVFGERARLGDRSPSYDPVKRRCADTYCHRNEDHVWTRPRASEDACGSCHGLPPPAPHPAATRCDACHGEVIARDRSFTAPELHVDGTVQVRDSICSGCHGSDDDPAPPLDLAGNDSSSERGVGAHQRHLAGGDSSRALSCGECHVVPDTVDDAGHLDGDDVAEVALIGVARAHGGTPSWSPSTLTCSDSWCHGPRVEENTSPQWTAQQSLGCDGCHGAPPAVPHPQIATCGDCHGSVVAGDHVTIIDRALHVDGVVQFIPEPPCNRCHGDDSSAAPPVALSGETSTSAPGVGAHRAHLNGSGSARAVSCETCHVVPSTWISPGHVDDTTPAEVVFSGIAVLWNAQPAYTNGRCADTYCHGASFVSGNASGGSLTEPSWTTVDGSQSACGTCHALPPPAPHPDNADDCSACHQNVDASRNFTRPDLHVDGDVTFQVQ